MTPLVATQHTGISMVDVRFPLALTNSYFYGAHEGITLAVPSRRMSPIISHVDHVSLRNTNREITITAVILKIVH